MMLFTEGTIGTLRLKNRIIQSAMHLGFPLAREAAFLAERARGGAALVTTVMGVSPAAAAADMPVLCEENRDAVRKMAGAVHAAGGKLSVQLFHVGRNCEEGALADPSARPAAPSPVPSPIYRTVPRELTAEDIGEICLQFGRAAAMCRACGADAVEVSCSAGYLLSEFLSSLTNRRTDRYGGDFAHRAEFPLEVLREVRRAAGERYPVILRISGADMLGGYGLRDMRRFVRMSDPWIDAVSVTGGWHESPVPQITMDVPEGGFAFLAKAIRQATGRPVIACNRIVSGECAQRLLDEGCGDFVGCAREFLADSAFAEKLRLGIPYLRCIGCNKGCIERVLRHRPATCVFNPSVGKELDGPLPAAVEPKRILVVGGGPSGLLSATYLSRMGHNVTLCTREAAWGGLLRYAGLPPHKGAILENVKALVHDAEAAGVLLRPETDVDEQFVRTADFDFYWIAEGCTERIPQIEGASCRRIYLAREIFEADQRTLAELAEQRVAIIGGGSVAAELAYYLCSQALPDLESRAFLDVFASPDLLDTFRPGGRITIIGRGDKIARDLGATRWILMKQLKRFPVELMTGSVVRRITESGLEILNGDHLVTREADAVIVAAGYQSRNSALVRWLEEEKKPYVQTGDCALQGSGILNATQSARETALFYGRRWNEQSSKEKQ